MIYDISSYGFPDQLLVPRMGSAWWIGLENQEVDGHPDDIHDTVVPGGTSFQSLL